MELEFKKYPKLTNHYNIEKERVFDNWMSELYYSDEKIDGSNTQMAFLIENNKIKDIKVGSRNHFIEADDKNNIAKVSSRGVWSGSIPLLDVVALRYSHRI